MRIRSIVLPVICASFFTSCSGQSQETSNLKKFDNSESGISVSLPCTPLQTEKKEYTYVAGKRFSWTFKCKDQNVDYEISVGNHNPDTPESTEKFLEYSKGDIELALAKFVRDKKEISISGRRAYQFFLSRDGTTGLINIVIANENSILHLKISPVAVPTQTEAEAKLIQRIVESVKF